MILSIKSWRIYAKNTEAFPWIFANLCDKVRQIVSFDVDSMMVYVCQYSTGILLFVTLLSFPTCNAGDIINAASTTRRELMYLICECYLTEKSICGNVLYHTIILCLSAIEIMLKSFMNVSHRWRWRSLSTLVVSSECCIKSIFHFHFWTLPLWSCCDWVDILTCLTTFNALQNRRDL